MDFGVHLPLADLGQGLLGGGDLRVYTATAAGLGFEMVSANDHLVWRRPWLDGLMSLASVAGSAGDMTLATSVALPAVRHPVVLAKAITSLAVLSESTVVAGLGPGSSAADYEAVGLPFAGALGALRRRPAVGPRAGARGGARGRAALQGRRTTT